MTHFLRPATPTDGDAIRQLCTRLADFPLPPGRTAEMIAVADYHLLDRQFAEPSDDVLFLVAQRDAGQVVGTIFANTGSDYFTKVPYAYVEVLAVSEAVAGQGIARQLLDAVEIWARDRGMRRVELAVFANNMRARGFYQHLGYSEEMVRCAKNVRRET